MLDERGSLPPGEVTALAVQSLDGLAHAHGLHCVDESGNARNGIIHRDIKPTNLLVDEHGSLKLTAFGIAKEAGENQFTKTGFSVGYMSPEQVRGLRVDARSDLYSLGVTLYEMLTGLVPFQRSEAGSDYDVFKAHVEKDTPSIHSLNPGILRRLADAVARALKKNPEQRWANGRADFREALLPSPQSLNPRPASGAPPGGNSRAGAGVAVLPFLRYES